MKLTSAPWVLGVLLICVLVCFPLLLILIEFFQPVTDGWLQLSQKDPGGLLTELGLTQEIPESTKLYERGKSSFIMLLGVGACSTVLGVLLAWIVSMWNFPLRKLLSFLLVLPLAIPSYILATAYKLLTIDTKNEVAVWAKKHYGLEAMQNIDQVWNYLLAIFVLSMGFYPYVYLAARTAFRTLSSAYLESARMLGESTFTAFQKIALRLARPAIVGGLLLVLLETLNEFGAMKILGINTLTTEIFYAWTNLDDVSAAMRLAGCMMVIVFFILLLEIILRGGKRYNASRSASTEFAGKKAGALGSTVFLSVGITVFSFAFALPCWKIVSLACCALPEAKVSDFSSEIISSLLLALKASAFITAVSLFVAYSHRLVPHWIMQVVLKVCNLGYAIPGAILGLTLITWSGFFSQSDTGYKIVEFIFYGSSIGIVIAYMIRFLVAGLNPIESGLKNIRNSLDEASRIMGSNSFITFFKVHLPMLKYSISAGLLILFIDILKELPLTLIMNHETLATRTYSLFAMEERYATGAIPALILILTGVSGIALLQFFFRNLKH